MLATLEHRRHHSLVLIALILISTSASSSGADRILRIDNFHAGELFCRGFKITKQSSIDLHVIGALSEFNRDQMAGYGWILRSGALKPTWEMSIDNTERYGHEKYLREYQSTLELQPGEYEVYFYAGSPSALSGISLDLGKMIDKIKQKIDEGGSKKEIIINGDAFDLSDSDVITDDIVKEYLFEISGDSKDITRSDCVYQSDRVIAEILQPENSLYASKGFSLSQPLQVEIAAAGEYAGSADDFADYGWIINAETRKRVWSMTEAASEPAGGASKNKMVFERLTLPKGDYVVYYVTDDSHTYDDWNAAPPYNPEAYGIRINAVKKDDLKYAKPFQDTYSQAALMAITRAGNDFFETKSFRIARDCDIRVYAIGECAGGDAFSDFGWIEQVGSERPYWEMTEANTHHAGGASKNREFDDIVHFRPGDYVLGYVTDDSHAYGDWNNSPPYDQKNYGISLYASGKADASVLKELPNESPSGNVLAKMTYVGNDADETQVFVLDKPTRVHIVALGEGVGSDMADYGWIERFSDGDIVWEMTYRKTKPAGGASKNRIVDTVVLLDAGKYRARFVSDDSHSFGNWNSAPPPNPQRWGITISKSE